MLTEIEDQIQRLAENLRNQDRSDSTVKTYAAALRSMSNALSKLPTDISDHDLVNYFRHMNGSLETANVRLHAISSLREVYGLPKPEFGKRVLRDLNHELKPSIPYRTITEEQFEQMLGKVKGRKYAGPLPEDFGVNRDLTALVLMYRFGARIGEVVAMNREHLSVLGGGIEATFGGKTTIVPYSDNREEPKAVSAYLSAWERERSKGVVREEALIVNRAGRRITERSLRRRMPASQRILRRSHLKNQSIKSS